MFGVVVDIPANGKKIIKEIMSDMDIHELIASCLRDDYMHIIVCEDGQLIPMTFVSPTEGDIAWAKSIIADNE